PDSACSSSSRTRIRYGNFITGGRVRYRGCEYRSGKFQIQCRSKRVINGIFSGKCATGPRDSVIAITLMHRRTGTSRPRHHTAGHAVETLLLNGEGSGDRRPHRDFDGNDDLVPHRFDNPAESAEHRDASAPAGVPRAVDREQDLLQDRLDVEFAPRAGLGAV